MTAAKRNNAQHRQHMSAEDSARTVFMLMSALLALALTFGELSDHHGTVRLLLSVGLVGITVALTTAGLVVIPGLVSSADLKTGLVRIAVTAAAVGGNLYGWTSLIAGGAS